MNLQLLQRFQGHHHKAVKIIKNLKFKLELISKNKQILQATFHKNNNGSAKKKLKFSHENILQRLSTVQYS